MIDPDEDDDGVRLSEPERRALWREVNGVSPRRVDCKQVGGQ